MVKCHKDTVISSMCTTEICWEKGLIDEEKDTNLRPLVNYTI